MSKSATTTDRFAGIGHPEDWLKNPTPGDVLMEDFLKLKVTRMGENIEVRVFGT
jgi:hypothetical protein